MNIKVENTKKGSNKSALFSVPLIMLCVIEPRSTVFPLHQFIFCLVLALFQANLGGILWFCVRGFHVSIHRFYLNCNSANCRRTGYKLWEVYRYLLVNFYEIAYSLLPDRHPVLDCM